MCGVLKDRIIDIVLQNGLFACGINMTNQVRVFENELWCYTALQPSITSFFVVDARMMPFLVICHISTNFFPAYLIYPIAIFFLTLLVLAGHRGIEASIIYDRIFSLSSSTVSPDE